MAQVRQAAVRVNSLLGSYIAVHDDCYGGGLRRIIPIPGIFKPIDFCKHEATLSEISAQLESCQSDASREVEEGGPESHLASALLQYVQALNAAVAQLQRMSDLLCRKSRGETSYSMEAYRRDDALYNQLVEAYTKYGGELNRAFHGR